VHEFAAAAAAEYFTASSRGASEKAFVLVTAGPGFTNTITAIASAWIESRQLLVIGGQVKSQDLSDGSVRQRGIQEINGIALAEPICKAVLQIRSPVSKSQFLRPIRLGKNPRQGPVFIEICLDAQGASVDLLRLEQEPLISEKSLDLVDESVLDKALHAISESHRPVLLVGGGCDYEDFLVLREPLSKLGIPIMTTWNGSDRISSDDPSYFGRPNTWGQRYSNVLMQQSDLLIAVGTRLGLQQTGFAWEEFIQTGKVLQVDIDKGELSKGHPKTHYPLNMDSSTFLKALLSTEIKSNQFSDWLDFCSSVKALLPPIEEPNSNGAEYIDPFKLIAELSSLIERDAVIIPCSSGGTFTAAMQSLNQKQGQRILSNKGMASMGYGLSGAIGASLANRHTRTYLLEGDGGFAQNLQELGTVYSNYLPLKMFVFANDGYASIRTTQKNYFNGAWVGCDSRTGLGLPSLEHLATAYKIPYFKISNSNINDGRFIDFMLQEGPALFEVPIDAEQTYFPKIASRVTSEGAMESNPLHLMYPELGDEMSKRVFRYIPGVIQGEFGE
jgi:acetolactate synthase-1/2/3 large subunit